MGLNDSSFFWKVLARSVMRVGIWELNKMICGFPRSSKRPGPWCSRHTCAMENAAFLLEGCGNHRLPTAALSRSPLGAKGMWEEAVPAEPLSLIYIRNTWPPAEAAAPWSNPLPTCKTSSGEGIPLNQQEWMKWIRELIIWREGSRHKGKDCWAPEACFHFVKWLEMLKLRHREACDFPNSGYDFRHLMVK